MSEGEREGAAPAAKAPSLLRNYVSFAGAAVAAAGLISVVLMLLLELTGSEDHNPYVGIFTYILFPSVMVFGLLVVLAGVLWERRRRRRMSPEEIARFPVLDLNNPRRRRSLVVFLVLTFVFLFMSAFGSYRAFEHTESVAFCGQTCHEVMKPEFVAYQAGAHARVRCVECHVGGGAEWYVRSKVSGTRQLVGVITGHFDRPIKTPVHNLRPAQDTCEQCHWPEKAIGTKLKVFDRFSYDELNTHRQTRLLVNVGGGSPASGAVSGIHWHMNLANEVTYAAADRQRQVIPWVRIKDRDGNVTEYVARDTPLAAGEIERMERRTMDCVDCHNRPAHRYLAPDAAVDQALAAGRLDQSLPYLKREAVAALTGSYATNDQAVRAVSAHLDQFYKSNYPDVYASRGDAVRGAAAEVQRIYQTYFFPEMKTDWQTHPDNIGHYYFQGCFRCHDGQHRSADGRVIRNECNICHTTLDQTEGGAPVAVSNGAYRHPVELGTLWEVKCVNCHSANRPFRHPVNLGDIREFKCSECHK